MSQPTVSSHRRPGGRLGTIRTSPFSPIKRSIGATLDGPRGIRSGGSSGLPVWPPPTSVVGTATTSVSSPSSSPLALHNLTMTPEDADTSDNSALMTAASMSHNLSSSASASGIQRGNTLSRADRQFVQFHLEHQRQSMMAARRFIEIILEESLPSDDLHACLHDGVILCRVINKLRPGMIQQIGRRSLPFVKMENISNFLNAAHELGLRSADLFRTVDLYEGKDMMQVAITLITLSRVVAMIPPSQLGLPDGHRRTKSEQVTQVASPVTPLKSMLNYSAESFQKEVEEAHAAMNGTTSISTMSSNSNGLGNRARPDIIGELPSNGIAITKREPLHAFPTDSTSSENDSSSSATPVTSMKQQLTRIVDEDGNGDTLRSTAVLPLYADQQHVEHHVRVQRRETLRRKMEEEQTHYEALATAQANLQANLNTSDDDNDKGHGHGRLEVNPPEFRPGSAPESNSYLNIHRTPPRLFPLDSSGGTGFNRRRPSRSDKRKRRPAHPPPVISPIPIDASSLVPGDVAVNNGGKPLQSPLLSPAARSVASTSKIGTSGRSKSRVRSTTGSQNEDMGQFFQSMHRRMHRESNASSIVTTESRDRLALYSDELEIIANYQLGNCIGKGQFGSVYRALNLETGQMVAIKRVYILDKDEKEVESLMQEVALLEKLTHTNVVKYEGFIKGDGFLNIVLEYIENGSLLTTLKSFGAFPEKLVASYTIKILEGLVYLHEQDVAHCDLKAANLLTTKDGNVKLSDFGVSLNLQLVESEIGEMIAGTPNWMAPEVIELKGASTASDIWSLGCTIVELLTGKPPYWGLLPMTTLFRIVEDDCPPLPEDVSPDLRDFLLKCFCKEPEGRPTAKELLDFPWLRDHVHSRSREANDSTQSHQTTSNQHERILQDSMFNPNTPAHSCNVSDNSLGTSISRRTDCQHIFVKATFGRRK
ncbi:kinase-like domain-containing protein [Syncephalis plumigaleata]|nr:kinase-like domain-containing protein [Syncephalis plumigaleata]